MNKFAPVFVAANILLLAACATSSGLQSGSSADIAIMGLDVVKLESRMKGGLMQARIELKNSSSRKLNMQYRINWQDSAGEPVEKEYSHWEPLVMQGNSTQSISQMAPSAKVVKYNLQIEKAH